MGEGRPDLWMDPVKIICLVMEVFFSAINIKLLKSEYA